MLKRLVIIVAAVFGVLVVSCLAIAILSPNTPSTSSSATTQSSSETQGITAPETSLTPITAAATAIEPATAIQPSALPATIVPSTPVPATVAAATAVEPATAIQPSALPATIVPSTPVPTISPEPQYYHLAVGDTPKVNYIPSSMVIGVGDTLTTVIQDLEVAVSLESFERTNSNNPKLFRVRFLLKNQSERSITFSPKDVFNGSNETQMTYSRGGAAHLLTEEPITIEPKSEVAVDLDWDSNRDFGKVWLTVNAPITNQKTVLLEPGKIAVFLIELPKI